MYSATNSTIITKVNKRRFVGYVCILCLQAFRSGLVGNATRTREATTAGNGKTAEAEFAYNSRASKKVTSLLARGRA